MNLLRLIPKENLIAYSVILILAFIGAITVATTKPKPKLEPLKTEAQAKPTFIGKSETGYELWKSGEGDCILVKKLKDGDLARLNVTLEEFKQTIKKTTGYSCVLFVN